MMPLANSMTSGYRPSTSALRGMLLLASSMCSGQGDVVLVVPDFEDFRPEADGVIGSAMLPLSRRRFSLVRGREEVDGGTMVEARFKEGAEGSSSLRGSLCHSSSSVCTRRVELRCD